MTRREALRAVRPYVLGVLGLLLCLGTLAALGAFSDPPSAVPELRGAMPRVSFAQDFDLSQFLKGNLHTHTKLSDGDSSPEDVILWYRSHGYQFLALTDHNLRSEPERYASLQDASFRLISGEEVTMTGGGRQVHVNALCMRETIPGGQFATAAEALRSATVNIRRRGGVALINHPNFDFGLGASDLYFGQEATLVEIMSGHPYVLSSGSDVHASHEALWDHMLGQGLALAGVAVDDLHQLRVSANPPAHAGRAWINLSALDTEPAALCSALRSGLLYASTGVELLRIRVSGPSYELWPAHEVQEVTFIGRGGQVLSRIFPVPSDLVARYALKPGDGYVRARVLGRDGSLAWTPAVFEAQ